MKINTYASARNVTFGYSFPAYYAEGKSTSKFIQKVSAELLSQNKAEYERYQKALQDFNNKRFNAHLYEEYLGASNVREFIAKLNPPIIVNKAIEEVHNVEPTPIKRLWDFCTGKKSQPKQIVETVNKPVVVQDHSNINLNISGVEEEQWGSTISGFTSRFYEIFARSGKEEVPVKSFEYSTSSYHVPVDFYENMLSSAEGIYKFINDIDNAMAREMRLKHDIQLGLPTNWYLTKNKTM